MTVASPSIAGRPARFPMTRLLSAAALLIVLVGIGAAASGSWSGLVTEMFIRMVVVVGIYIFVGNSGVISFGHISFMSIGAYAAAWMTCCTLPMVKPMYLPGLPEWLQSSAQPAWTGIAVGVVTAAVVAIVVGVTILRLSGIAASIASFGVLVVQYNIYSNWDSVTAGTSSISNIPVYVTPLTASLFAAGAIVLASLHQNSRLGVMLRATRDDEPAARASGIGVFYTRFVAFVLSAVVVSVGGALHAGFLGTVSVDSFYMTTTFLTVTMLIIGGVSSLTGAILGVVLVTAATWLLRLIEAGTSIGGIEFRPPSGFQELSLGVVMVLFLIFRPRGAMGLVDFFDLSRLPKMR